jgi:3-dehydroquinate dehydratase-2
VKLPTWEIHLTDPMTREKFRHVSLVRDICVGHTAGLGPDGYVEALDGLVAYLREEDPA